ncbi:hypothetical protein R103_M10241 [Saccharomyces cerevisiae R103]|uniref:EC1118_1M3_0353p n=1 Tax=Saccharomyces cerevisiae (strain Lalvin EC1118 / Prise de mousse) TaxID=643680 RepID=C8ZEA1_YEAS8|nr:hypothetical protein R008_M10251 [Saccharomyces cerevisiae R008]EWG94255.1 hypothetical protein R103_M10241 [Saccharomyces cerevisiae R103]CAY81717.1 EC1118_1M3_0353p [Saccharomyces cerevisiae EC1118]
MYRIKYIKNHKSTGVGCMRLFLLSLLLQGIFFTGSMFTIPPASRWFLAATALSSVSSGSACIAGGSILEPNCVSVLIDTYEQNPSVDEISRVEPSSDHAKSVMGE